ncbi:class I peptide chain release factor [Fibrella aestuarina BUZ 2]|uniref:Class I peptide chain release factor n=1 Tax=Fibrella aestuarina BUZ 2 TaxID=1166018 RepID=I0K1N0_9BACT|nr:alternative ribosome rescue aminoacyl-tRNA hydrolase ArfB [Fibrella aestuarina]CCG98033.1 class I peptide chain release factor [Fibrella aestuarina BUZ 2]
MLFDPRSLHSDLRFQFARSGGAGGQNVNKVATKAELRFSVRESTLLTDEQRATLLDKLANKLTTEGELVLTHQTERTQLANREKVIKKFDRLIAKAFEVPKPRKATKPSAGMIAQRLDQKKRRSEVKASRRRIDD